MPRIMATVTITGHYDMPDSPDDRFRAYGERDVDACLRIDEEEARTKMHEFLEVLVFDKTEARLALASNG